MANAGVPSLSKPSDARALAVRPPAGLAVVLALTWLGSLGTGAVTNGLFFVTHELLSFSEARNLLLALVMGASYTLGAWRAAPLVRALARRSARVTIKRVLVGVNVALALVSVMPYLVGGAAWAFWVMAAVYLPLTGILWPVIEAYLSGGRTGADLRRATGAFNIAWSSAVLAAFWAMAPLLEHNPLAVVAGMALVHVACVIIALALPPEPSGHIEGEHEPAPPVYSRLLAVFRVLLTLSYVLVNALEPLLPTRLTALGVSAGLKAPLASVWAAARVAVFGLCMSWHGWHGRWRTVIWTAGAMLTGFTLAVSAGSVAVMIVGLALFGLGVGGVYLAAIYYAMAVGRAEVDAGGRHETVIGLGYTVGPLPALAAHAALGVGSIGEGSLTGVMLGIVAVLVAGAGVWAWRAARPKPGAPKEGA